MKQNHRGRLKVWRRRALQSGLAVLVFFISGVPAHAQFLVPELVFENPQLRTGPACAGAGQDGAVYLFPNAGPDIDALVMIRGRSSSLVTLRSPDRRAAEQDAANGTEYDACWQPVVSYRNGRAPAHTSWWMEFKISFVKHDHPEQSVSVNQFFVSGLQIDGDGGSLHEYLSFYNTASFNLERHSLISAAAVKGCVADRQTLGSRFDGPTKKYNGVDLTGPDVTVNGFYSNTNSLVLRVGAETGEGGSDSADRMYSLLFKSLTFDVPHPASPPLTLIAFDRKMENNLLIRCGRQQAAEDLQNKKDNTTIDINAF